MNHSDRDWRVADPGHAVTMAHDIAEMESALRSAGVMFPELKATAAEYAKALRRVREKHGDAFTRVVTQLRRNQQAGER